MTVSSRGAIFTFSPELAGLADETYGDLSIGQLPDDTLDDILARPAFQRMWGGHRAGYRSRAGAHAPISTCAWAERRPTSWPSTELRGDRNAVLPPVASGRGRCRAGRARAGSRRLSATHVCNVSDRMRIERCDNLRHSVAGVCSLWRRNKGELCLNEVLRIQFSIAATGGGHGRSPSRIKCDSACAG